MAPATVDDAYLLAAGFPWQCLTSCIMVATPFPSHPTGHSVFPNTAVRQSSSHSMRSRLRVPDHPTPDVDQAPGVQGAIRVLLPSESSAFTAIVQVTSKAGADE